MKLKITVATMRACLVVLLFTAAARAQGEGGVGADGTKVQLARWDVILNDNATESIEAVDSKMIDTKSAVYHAELFNADALRAGINAAAAAGGLEGASQGMAHTQSFGPGGYYMQPLYFNYMMEATTHVSLNGNATGNESITSDGADKLHVQINYSQIDGRIYEMANGRQNSTTLDKKASINFDGQIAAGDALTMSATIKGKSGTSYRHMIVWEVFKAEQQFQQNYQQIQDSQRWCQIGPAGIRHAAQVAVVWAGGATHPASQVGEKWEKKLDDGMIIRLTGITRSDKWMYCWWDADGNPLANTNNELGFVSFVKYYADRPVWFAVQVSGSEDEWKKQFPTGHPSRNFGQQSGSFTTSIATVSDQNGTATVGVPVGDWEKISEIKKGQTIKVGTVTYRLQDIQSMGDEGVFAQFYVQRGDPTGGDLVTLSVMKNDGTEVDTDYVQMITAKNYGTPQPQFQGVKLADVKTFEVWRRKHQWVTFSGFATEPVKPPNDQVTDADLAAALEAQKKAAFAAQVEAAKKQVEALVAKRKEWEAIAADPTTPKGALRAMFVAAGKGDLKSVRARLKSSQPDSGPLLDGVARVITSTQVAREAAVARFGEENVLAMQGGGQNGQPLLIDLEMQMMEESWTPRADGGLQANEVALVKGDDGQFYLDLGLPKEKTGGQDLNAMLPMFVAMSMRAEQISRMLKDNPSMTIDQFTAAMGK